MKKLTCEMCESTDFVKQENVFVCQSCGLKYSTEEAKKMMTGEVGSTAASNPGKLDNLYQLARRARDESNTEKAAQYYEQILPEDPNSWEAMFYSTYYAAIQKWRNDEKGSALSSLQNCIGNVIDIIDGTGEHVAVAEIVIRINNICSGFYGANEESFEAFYQRYKEAGYSSNNMQIFCNVLQQTSTINHYIAKIYYVLAVKVQGMVNDQGGLESIVEAATAEAIRVVNRNPCSYALIGYSQSGSFPAINSIKRETESEASALERSCNEVRERMKEKQEALAKQRFKEYWDAHQTEKTALESEKQSLTQQIAASNREISETDGYLRLVELQKKAENFASELSTFGFFKSLFKGTEKKALQEQIDSTNAEIAPIRERISPTINAIKKRIAEYESRIKDIDTELTKPR